MSGAEGQRWRHRRKEDNTSTGVIPATLLRASDTFWPEVTSTLMALGVWSLCAAWGMWTRAGLVVEWNEW